MFVYMFCFTFAKWLVLWIIWQRVYMYEKSLEMCICLWPESDRLEVTKCGWQDVKIQLLTKVIITLCMFHCHVVICVMCHRCVIIKKICSVAMLSFVTKVIFFLGTSYAYILTVVIFSWYFCNVCFGSFLLLFFSQLHAVQFESFVVRFKSRTRCTASWSGCVQDLNAI